MTAQSSGTQVCAPLLIYMVAGSYWCPTLRAGGLRVDPWAQRPGIAVRMTDANKHNAALPLFPGEQPKTHEVKEWWKAAKPHITADQFALYNGTTPRGLLDYSAASIPVALVASENSPTESAVQQRVALILSLTDSNNVKALKRDAHIGTHSGRAPRRRLLGDTVRQRHHHRHAHRGGGLLAVAD